MSAAEPFQAVGVRIARKLVTFALQQQDLHLKVLKSFIVRFIFIILAVYGFAELAIVRRLLGGVALEYFGPIVVVGATEDILEAVLIFYEEVSDHLKKEGLAFKAPRILPFTCNCMI